MTERIYPSAAKAATNQPPPSKSHRNPPIRHQNPYRTSTGKPPLPRRRSISARRCLCQVCLWSTIVVLGVLLLAVIAAAAFYVLYHPHLPQFSPTSLKISSFNLTTTSDGVKHLTTRVNLTLSSKNPNSKISFFYDPVTVTLLTLSDVALSGGSFPAFNSTPNAINVLHATMGLTSQLLDVASVNSLEADLKAKKGLPLKIVMDTMVRVKFEKLNMRKIGIRLTCDGIRGVLPKGKSINSSNTLNSKCEVDLRIRILKTTF